MSFFEPPPPQPEPPQPPRMPWWGPPDNIVGAVVPLGLTLARTDEVAVTVGGVVAYWTGLTLTLAVRSRNVIDDSARWPFHHPRLKQDPLAPDIFRFGIEFADGRKATTLGHPFGRPTADEPDIVLVPHGGGGGGRRWDQEFWLWPLPPIGPLSFVCEWPSFGIELTRRDIDAELVLEAAARAEPLWPDDDEDGGPESFTTRHQLG